MNGGKPDEFFTWAVPEVCGWAFRVIKLRKDKNTTEKKQNCYFNLQRQR
jgi:hypothetical protein